MNIISRYETALQGLTRGQIKRDGSQEQRRIVQEIIESVRARGDIALFEYTEKYDGVKLESLEIKREDIEQAYLTIDIKLKKALELAASRIADYHQRQKDALVRDDFEGTLGWIMRPLKRVGLYVPGGLALLPSSLMMTAIPAGIAGVKEKIVVTPPQKNGKVADIILAAAHIAGVDRVFSIGGAQAIASLAYGTNTIPAVDKIFGPGNIFVTLAKKMVYGDVGIDGLYGPSEVFIIADNTANASYCAADMLGQLEHGAGASAILVTTSQSFAKAVAREIQEQVKNMPRQKILKEAVERHCTIAVVDNIDQAIELGNSYAPEHLCMICRRANEYIDKITNAGCVFIGENAIEVLVDYVAGPNHVLPTEGTARFNSTLNITDYFKIMTLVNTGQDEIRQLGGAAARIARAEGLEAHARAIERRMENLGEPNDER